MSSAPSRQIGIAGACLLLVCSATFGDNLLVNGGFENNGYPSSPCSTGWTQGAGTVNCKQSGSVFPPPEGVAYEGMRYASTDRGNPTTGQNGVITRTVNLPGGGDVRLFGAIAGTQDAGSIDHFVRIHNGSSTAGTLVAEFEITSSNDWVPFDISGTPAGGQVTVAWGFDNVTGVPSVTATHVDGLYLVQPPLGCTADAQVDSVAPAFGVIDPVVPVSGFQVFGQNFPADAQVRLVRDGFPFPDIEATGEVVSGGGTVITCDLPLIESLASNPPGPGQPSIMGKWNVVVSSAACDDAVLLNGFIVAFPTLTNGGFERPAGSPGCPNPPAFIKTFTFGWLQSGITSAVYPDYNQFVRDINAGWYLPSCPRPEGQTFATIFAAPGNAFGHWTAYQYIAVTPGQQITICGEFAVGGRTHSTLELHDGDELGTLVAEQDLFNRIGCVPPTDWMPACLTGTPPNGLVTLSWRSEANVTINSAVHADALALTVGPPPAEICDNSIDDDGDLKTDCADDDCSAAPGCEVPPTEICDNDIDDDGDLLLDCDDDDCDGSLDCIEICGNGIDDDYDCTVDINCEICDDLIDNDGNGLIDCLDPGCLTSPACPCNDPFADADADGDVDQEDFAPWQRCFTETMQTLSPECACFDRDVDSDVDIVDFLEFTSCATGPEIPFDAQNPPPGCNP